MCDLYMAHRKFSHTPMYTSFGIKNADTINVNKHNTQLRFNEIENPKNICRDNPMNIYRKVLC